MTETIIAILEAANAVEQGLKQRAMRYQAGDKDLVAAYLTAIGQPTKSTELDLPFDDWMTIRRKYFADAVNWKRAQNGLPPYPKQFL